MAVPVNLTEGAISMIASGNLETTDVMPVLQVTDVRIVPGGGGGEIKERYRLMLSDGSFIHQGIFSQRFVSVKSQQLQKGSIVQLKEFVCNTIRDSLIIIILELDVILTKCDVIGDPKPYLARNTVGMAESVADALENEIVESEDEEDMPNTKRRKTTAADEITKIIEKGLANIHKEMQKLVTVITSSSLNQPSLDGIPRELRIMGFASTQIIQVCLNFANNPNHLRVWNSLDASLKSKFVETLLEADN